MEDIKITINEKHPGLRLLKKPIFWLFTLCAILVAVIEFINDNPICSLWALLAAVMHAFVLIFQMYADDFVDLCFDLTKEIDTMAGVLKEKDNEIQQLKTENVSLRFKKSNE